MTASKPDSKAGQLRQANKVLAALLRTPKTRTGLCAAVTKGSISRNFVYGWLAERRRDGTVTTLKSGSSVMYQITAHIVSEVPVVSDYPSWLDPRALPTAASRDVYVNGKLVGSKEKK